MRERREVFLAALSQGQIPNAHPEIEENYQASQTIAAYGAHPDPNVHPATQSPYWWPSGPTTKGAFIAQMQRPPRIRIPDNTPIPEAARAWGLYPSPETGKVRIQIPGTEQIVDVSVDQMALCACLEWSMWRFLRLLPQIMQTVPQQAKPPAHLSEPFASIRADIANDVASPIDITGSFFSRIVRREIPNMHNGVVTSMFVETDNEADFDDIEWRLVLNGTPIRGFDSILWRPGSPETPMRLNLTIPENGTFDVEAQARTLTSVYRAVVRLNGYDYQLFSRTEGIRGTMTDLVQVA